MLPFKIIYSDDYFLPIGSHVFPGEKYKRIHERLLSMKVVDASDFVAPRPAADEDILLVHTAQYVHKLKTGTLSAREELEMEVPYSRELAQAYWLAAGGSMLAADYALNDGFAISIGGGFHHAFPDHGEGFCMINDIAVAIRRMQADEKIRKAMTIDCDVHQGNGTAVIFAPAPRSRTPATMGGDPNLAHLARTQRASIDVFTISLHQENNYPQFKPPSSLDINLPDGMGDAEYLAVLGNAISIGLEKFPNPELICYVAGADPYRDDQLGGLGLTIEGLKRRDALVFQLAKAAGIPVMVTLAGGYAHQLEDTVTIHSNTVVAAKEVYGTN